MGGLKYSAPFSLAMGGFADKTLFALVSDFFKIHLPNEKKCSPNTIRAYQTSLDMLFEFIKAKNGIALREVTFAMITRKTLLEFLDYLETERRCSVATRNHRLQSIRAFYNYVSQTEISAVVYWEEIKKVPTARTPEALVEHMSEAAVEAILDQPDTSTMKGMRDMFLMLFLYQTGARIQELLDIRLRDIILGKTPIVILHGKGSKSRPVPLRDKAAKHLEEYIKIFHSEEKVAFSEQYLFYVVRNGMKKRMTEDNARHLIHEYGVAARSKCPEVPENVHPHLFRHSCAMHLYQHGVELTLVSQWLGHANLETSLIYAHADTELKRKAIANAIPEDSPLKEHLNADRYKVDDEDMLKRLCGLK
jgi:integrase/recombinase XerD